MRNWSYTITEGEHAGTTLWSGRYCAVCGIVWINHPIDGSIVLVTKRGSGAADFQGKWCLPCGYLEADETGKEGLCREIKEETGYEIPPAFFKLEDVQTDPSECNKGNVTIIYSVELSTFPVHGLQYTEEVSKVKWISTEKLHEYEWAFNHNELIKRMFYSKK